jgi:hypothetical protein
MKYIYKLLETFFISGATVTSISYIGNQYNPLVAGIISGIPISIPSMLLIKSRHKQQQFIYSAFIMVSFLAIITGLCSYLVTYTSLESIYCVLITFILWCVGAFFYYLYINEK